MAEPIYDILFSVSRTPPAVSPTAPQKAGFYGDDGFARISFTLDNGADRHRYRIEVEDANGAYDVTELLDIKNGAVSYTVPAAWTAAGIAKVRLVEVEVDGDTETAILHYPAAKLFFEAREDGTAMGEMLPRWQTVMAEAQEAAQKALVLAENSANILHVTVENGIASHSPSEIKAFRDNGGVVVVNGNAFFSYGDDASGSVVFAHNEISTDWIQWTEYFIHANKRTFVDTYPHICTTDRTLTKQFMPADAKAVGDKFMELGTAVEELQNATEKTNAVLRVTVENGVASHSPSEIRAFRDNGGVVVVNDSAFLVGFSDEGVVFHSHYITVDYNVTTEYHIHPDKSVYIGTLEHDAYINIDPTLSVYGMPADAGAVGLKFLGVESDIEVLRNATEKTNAVLRVTVENGVASHSPSEIRAFRDAGGFVLLGDNAFLTYVDEYNAYFESHKINLETVGRTDYMIYDDKRVEIIPLNYEGITDKTLTKQWVAADAKAVGDKFSDMESDVDGLRTEIGDIETALDSILAIQEQLIGGDGE